MAAISIGQNDWETRPEHMSTVSIGTHHLFCHVSGPLRRTTSAPATPLVIVVAGAGDVASSYAALSRLIVSKARLLLYDRSGLGRSEDRPFSAKTSTTGSAILAARELCLLLDAIAIPPPYILLAHSYGAIIAREFLHLKNQDVIGAVFVDPSTERQHEYFKVQDANIFAMSAGINFATATGLRADSKLSQDEWRARSADIRRGSEATQAEADAYVESCRTLGAKKQTEREVLGDRPASIIRCDSKRDFQRLYEAGLEAGNGTDEERRYVKELLDRWDEIDLGLKKPLVKLSSKSRFVEHLDTSHNIHITKPEAVADEIDWILGNLTSYPLSLSGESKM